MHLYMIILFLSELNSHGIKKKPSAVRSHEVTNRLCKSLRDCLHVTTSLTCIELQGLPLRERDLTALAKVKTMFCYVLSYHVYYCIGVYLILCFNFCSRHII